ncbi:MAG: hypothetical protein AAF417_17980 [Pseudomonadota bacterium]
MSEDEMSMLEDVEFGRPVDVLIWASRVYLMSLNRGRPVPRFVPETFEDGKLTYVYQALIRVIVRLIQSTNSVLQVHDPRCPCRSDHERAFIAALDSLQAERTADYHEAMNWFLPRDAARDAFDDMCIIASGLADMQRWWPTDTESEQTTAYTPPAATGSVLLH